MRLPHKVLGTLLALSCASAASQDAASVFARAKNSVYVVRVQAGGTSAQGSAVRVGADLVVTNCHVVEGSVQVLVHANQLELPATQLHADPQRDLCTLRVPGLPPAATPPIRLLSSLRVGERVVALGAPRGLELSLSEGIISGIRDTPAGRMIQTTSPISPGSSGGALLDMQGRLVGITSSQRRDSQNLNFAAPAEWISEIADRHASVSQEARRPEPQVLKLSCRGLVKSDDAVATRIRGASQWTDTVEAELDVSAPAVRLTGFLPTILTRRSPGWLGAAEAANQPYALTAMADLLLHSDSDTRTSSEGTTILSVDVVINRKTAEMTLRDTKWFTSADFRVIDITSTVGTYQCEPSRGRKF